MRLRVLGPKGHLVVRQIGSAALTKRLPALIHRFKKVSVTAAPALPPAMSQVRARILEFCRWSISTEPQWHYAQARPMERVKTPAELRQLPREADCSEHATDAYAYAGAPDPNGENYNGTGWTGTLLKHCRHIPKAKAKAADLVVFGAGDGHHVVVLLEDATANGGDPLVCSHGQERGPISIRLSVETAAQPAPVTFLTCLD